MFYSLLVTCYFLLVTCYHFTCYLLLLTCYFLLVKSYSLLFTHEITSFCLSSVTVFIFQHVSNLLMIEYYYIWTKRTQTQTKKLKDGRIEYSFKVGFFSSFFLSLLSFWSYQLNWKCEYMKRNYWKSLQNLLPFFMFIWFDEYFQ